MFWVLDFIRATATLKMSAVTCLAPSWTLHTIVHSWTCFCIHLEYCSLSLSSHALPLPSPPLNYGPMKRTDQQLGTTETNLELNNRSHLTLIPPSVLTAPEFRGRIVRIETSKHLVLQMLQCSLHCTLTEACTLPCLSFCILALNFLHFLLVCWFLFCFAFVLSCLGCCCCCCCCDNKHTVPVTLVFSLNFIPCFWRVLWKFFLDEANRPIAQILIFTYITSNVTFSETVLC